MGGPVSAPASPADPTGRPSVPGVWVAGNVTDLSAQVVVAAAGGMRAGGAMNADLAEEDLRVAAEHRRLLAAMFEQAGWEERYAERPAVWSGRANPQLVAEAPASRPGRALDVGSRGGRRRAVAGRARLAGHRRSTSRRSPSTGRPSRAADAGADVARRTEWRRADLRGWAPADGDRSAYDLVTSHFVHLPDRGMATLLPRLAEAVAPGRHAAGGGPPPRRPERWPAVGRGRHDVHRGRPGGPPRPRGLGGRGGREAAPSGAGPRGSRDRHRARRRAPGPAPLTRGGGLGALVSAGFGTKPQPPAPE